MRDNSVIKANLLVYLSFKGISKYQFYQQTGISNGVLSQKNGLSEDNLLKSLSYYSDLNPAWLLTGKGQMILRESDTTHDIRLLEIQDLNAEDQQRIYSLLDALIRDAKARG